MLRHMPRCMVLRVVVRCWPAPSLWHPALNLEFPQLLARQKARQPAARRHQPPPGQLLVANAQSMLLLRRINPFVQLGWEATTLQVRCTGRLHTRGTRFGAGSYYTFAAARPFCILKRTDEAFGCQWRTRIRQVHMQHAPSGGAP